MKEQIARMEDQQVRSDKRIEVLEARADERMRATMRDMRINIWSAAAVFAAMIVIFASIVLRYLLG